MTWRDCSVQQHDVSTFPMCSINRIMVNTQLTRNDTIYFANKIVVFFFISSRGSINGRDKSQFNKTYGIERGINYFS